MCAARHGLGLVGMLAAASVAAQTPISTEPPDTRAARLAYVREDSAFNDVLAQRGVDRAAWLKAQVVDTVVIGGVRWHLAPTLRMPAEAILRQLDATLTARGTPPLADLLGTRDGWLLNDSPPWRSLWEGFRRGRPSLHFSRNGDQWESVDPFTREVLQRALDHRLSASLWAHVDAPLRRWARTAPMQFGSSPFSRDDMRAVLVAAPDARGARCANGDLAACESVLLDTTAAGTAFSGPLRAALITSAISAGGAGSMLRLLADSTATIDRRLEAAGGRPFRDLVVAWHRDSIAPDETSPIRSAFLAIGLAVILSAAGVRRPA